MDKRIIAGVGVLVLLGATVGAYAITNDRTSQTAEELNDTIDINADRNGTSENAGDFSDDELQQLLCKTIYGSDSDSYSIYRSDVQKYLNKTNGILKLDLNENVKSLSGLDIVSDVQDLWISNATNPNLNWSAIKDLKNLKSLTIVNSTLSPSDISMYITYLVHNCALEELYINASFPGEKNNRDSYKQIDGNGSTPYIQALNSINVGSVKKLRVLSLVGNKWQGRIEDLQTLKDSKCSIALDSNSHINSDAENITFVQTQEGK